MAKAQRLQRKQSIWGRKSFLAVAGALVLIVGISSVLLVKRAARAPTPIPKRAPVVARKSDPEPPTPILKISDELGGEVQVASLAKLYSVAQQLDLNQSSIKLSMAGQRRGSTPHVKTGQEFRVLFRSSHHCYFAVFHRDSSGQIELAAPRPNEPTKLEKIEGEQVSAEATPPGGEQAFLFVCADNPIKLQSVLSGDAKEYKKAFAASVLSYFAQEK